MNRCPTLDDWDACVWLDPNGSTKPTAQELTDALYPESYQKQLALDSIYAPVTYNGKDYPVDPESMAKYEITKQSKGRGKTTKAIAIAVDGSITKLSNPQAIDDFHEAIEDVLVARLAAVHDAL